MRRHPWLSALTPAGTGDFPDQSMHVGVAPIFITLFIPVVRQM